MADIQWWLVAMILLGLLALICFSALFWISEQAGSSQICRPLNLHHFVLDILDPWLRFVDALLGLIPLHLVILGMSCSLSSGD
jgi:H+/Cl- antiporter ClcA